MRGRKRSARADEDRIKIVTELVDAHRPVRQLAAVRALDRAAPATGHVGPLPRGRRPPDGRRPRGGGAPRAPRRSSAPPWPATWATCASPTPDLLRPGRPGRDSPRRRRGRLPPPGDRRARRVVGRAAAAGRQGRAALVGAAGCATYGAVVVELWCGLDRLLRRGGVIPGGQPGEAGGVPPCRAGPRPEGSSALRRRRWRGAPMAGRAPAGGRRGARRPPRPAPPGSPCGSPRSRRR